MTAEQTISERVENVLPRHIFTLYPSDLVCDCEWSVDGAADNALIAAWIAHVAEHLAAVLAPVVAEAKAEALREAVEDWQVGGWSNVLLPAPTPPAVPVIAYSNRVLDWLRDRVEQIGQA